MYFILSGIVGEIFPKCQINLEDAGIGIDQDSIVFKKKELKEKIPVFFQ